MPRSPVIPELVHPDVREAVAWQYHAFGFVERWTAGDHRAQLAVGDAAIVVMTTTATDARSRRTRRPPKALAGHEWTFSQTIADVAPEDWGGQSAPAS